jgi:trimeric autotransporter adhesin
MTDKDLTYDGGCMSSIAPGKVCRVVLSLWPHKTGTATAMLSITGNVTGSPLHVAISAIIIAPQANVSPSSLSFANQTVNSTSAPKTVTLSNNGIGPLTISGVAISGSNSADFLLTNNCGNSLAQGSSCTVSVSFKPKSRGSRSATLKFSDNAQSSTQAVSLSGSGK